MTTRINSVMNQLILAVSACFGTTLPSLSRCRLGYPASRNAAFHLPASKPSNGGRTDGQIHFVVRIGYVLGLERHPELGDKVLGAVAVGELGECGHEDMQF